MPGSMTEFVYNYARRPKGYVRPASLDLWPKTLAKSKVVGKRKKKELAKDPGLFASAKLRTKWHEQEYRRRMREQRSQYSKARCRDTEPVNISKGEIVQLRYASILQRIEILTRDRHKCRYCQCAVTIESANIDHVVPYKYGGLTEIDNLVACCRACNKAKGNNTWEPSANIRVRKPRQSTAMDLST